MAECKIPGYTSPDLKLRFRPFENPLKPFIHIETPDKAVKLRRAHRSLRPTISSLIQKQAPDYVSVIVTYGGRDRSFVRLIGNVLVIIE